MIYIIRHGQTKLNKARVLQGRSDEPLNEDGKKQAEEAAELLARNGITIDRVWTSPLQRAVQTAQIIVGPDTPIQTNDLLLEMDYGPSEGADLMSPPPEIIEFFSDFVNNPAPAGMEPLHEVVDRLGVFIEQLRPALREDENVLISTHAIAMKGALEYLTPESKGSYWNKHIANCEIYITELKDGVFTIPTKLGE